MFLQSSFKVAQRSFKSASSTFLNPTFWRPSKRLMSTNVRTPFTRNTINSNVTAMGLIIGASSAVLLHSHSSRILNEVTNLGTININTSPEVAKLVDTQKLKNPRRSRFGGKLNYKRLCYGSLSGLFFGVVLGKLSTVLGFIAFSAFLLVQFLETRGYINIPWNTVIEVGREKINLRQLIFEDPSFKISFLLSFAIAAVNI